MIEIRIRLRCTRVRRDIRSRLGASRLYGLGVAHLRLDQSIATLGASRERIRKMIALCDNNIRIYKQQLKHKKTMIIKQMQKAYKNNTYPISNKNKYKWHIGGQQVS